MKFFRLLSFLVCLVLAGCYVMPPPPPGPHVNVVCRVNWYGERVCVRNTRY